MFLAGEAVVELKVVPALIPLHRAQALSYLKVTDKQIGLLLNFGGPKPDFERLYFHRRAPMCDAEAAKRAVDAVPDTYLHPELTAEIINGLYDVHCILGPGFIYRLYASACHQELQQRGLEVKREPVMQVIYKRAPVGQIKFDHLRIENIAMTVDLLADRVYPL